MVSLTRDEGGSAEHLELLKKEELLFVQASNDTNGAADSAEDQRRNLSGLTVWQPHDQGPMPECVYKVSQMEGASLLQSDIPSFSAWSL